jgi:glutathione S-transferase
LWGQPINDETQSSSPVLRIFSYLPNPRVWKSLIAGRLSGVEVETRGAKPNELSQWLWDFDARRLAASEQDAGSANARTGRRGFAGLLFKTDAFLAAHPCTVPAAYSPDGRIGIFESNSILRAVARAGNDSAQLYGTNDYEASRIDSFLDAGLVFAREAQVYLLGVADVTEEGYDRMAAAYEFYLAGVEAALAEGDYLAGDTLSIADISFVCDFAQFLREGHYEEQLSAKGFALISENGASKYQRSFDHMLELSERPEFAEVMGTYLNWYRRKAEAK